jgi:hypothetical protein
MFYDELFSDLEAEVAAELDGLPVHKSEAKTDGPRTLRAIAREIRADWKNVYFGAVPYLEAMEQLDSVDDQFFAEDGKTQVLYFLSNAQTWRGDTARRVKAELKKMAGIK